jgi:hypothetical protein
MIQPYLQDRPAFASDNCVCCPLSPPFGELHVRSPLFDDVIESNLAK